MIARIGKLVRFSSCSLGFILLFAPIDEKCQDDPKIYDGALAGLQIGARKHEEEYILAIIKIVDTALKNHDLQRQDTMIGDTHMLQDVKFDDLSTT